MNIYFPYALVLAIFLSLVVFTGCVTGRKSLVLFGMIFAALVASPITTFTRGAAGAIYASDFVSFVLLFCWFLPKTQAMMFSLTPTWYRRLFWLMMIGLFSTLFIAPFFTGNLESTGYASHVRSPIPGIPLAVLMAGFRLFKILLYLPYFVYACHLIIDEKTLRFVYKTVLLAIVILGICQIIDSVGIKDMAFYLPSKLTSMHMLEHVPHILGHVKLAAGRLYMIGVFICLILLYRSWASLIYLLAMGIIVMAILFSGSRAALVGMFVALMVLGLYGKMFAKVLTIVLVGCMPIAFMVLSTVRPELTQSFMDVLEDPFSNPRWMIWEWSVVNLFTHPNILFTGVGYSNFTYAMAGEAVTKEHAHNDLLTCITELGLIGGIIFISFVFHLGRTVISKIKFSAGYIRWEAVCMASIFFGFLIMGMLEMTLYYSPHNVCMQRIFFVLFGTYTSWCLQQDYMLDSEIEIDDMKQEDFSCI